MCKNEDIYIHLASGVFCLDENVSNHKLLPCRFVVICAFAYINTRFIYTYIYIYIYLCFEFPPRHLILNKKYFLSDKHNYLHHIMACMPGITRQVIALLCCSETPWGPLCDVYSYFMDGAFHPASANCGKCRNKCARNNVLSPIECAHRCCVALNN